MIHSHPPFWRLFLIFLLLWSHKTVICDITNETSVQSDGFSRTDDNSFVNISETKEARNTLFRQLTSEILIHSVFQISRKNLENAKKFENFIIAFQPKIHSNRVMGFRHRRLNPTRNNQSTENTQTLPHSMNGPTDTRSKYLRSMPQEIENKIHSPRETRNMSFLAKTFSTDAIKYYKNRAEAKMLNKFHHARDASRDPSSRYAYFADDSNLQNDENFDNSFGGCYKTHDTCLTPDRSHQNRRGIMCSCDDDCEDYGNCCVDHKLRYVSTEMKSNVRYSCAKTGTYAGYFVLPSCPSFWKNTYVRSLCESSNNDESDVFLQVPVSNRDTYATYSNIYCAFCNGDTNVEFWSVQAWCLNSSNVHSTDDRDLKGCSHRFLEPHSVKAANILKKCSHSVVSNCPQHWVSQTQNQTAMEVVMKCALLYAPVSLFGMWTSEATIYKNEFCAICNGITAIHLFCPVINMPRSSKLPPGPPLSILLDMDFTRGGMIVGSQSRCPHMHLYDPWNKECRSVACKPHFEYKEGRCVPQKAYSDNLLKIQQGNKPFNGSLFSDCVQAIFSLEEVSILENGTLVILSQGSFYQPEEYESTDNSTVTICIRRGTYSLYVSTFTSFQGYLTVVGMGISLTSLLIRIILSIFFPERHRVPPRIVIFLSITLLFSQILFVFGIYQTENHVACVVIGILMHYGFLSSFFWTNVLAYDIWKTFGSARVMKKARCGEKQLIYYCVHGWINPLFIVTLAAAFDWISPYENLKPWYGKSVCWISNKAALATFFGLPLAILLVSNAVFFFITSVEIRKTTKATKFAHDSCSGGAKNRGRFGLYCKLAFIMGLTWVFGFIAAFSGSSILWYFFIAFNSIQGVYIFVAFTHFRIPLYVIPKKSSQWTLSGNSLTSRSSTARSAAVAKL